MTTHAEFRLVGKMSGAFGRPIARMHSRHGGFLAVPGHAMS